MSGWQIREWQSTDCFEALTALLRSAYAQLAGMGLRFLATHQGADVTRERVMTGTCFLAVSNEQLMGTITLYEPKSGEECDYYARTDVAHFGQFAVKPGFQKSGIGTALLEHVERIAKQRGFAHMALDTAEPAAHLIEYYQKRGYSFVQFVQWDCTNYRSVVMSKPL